MAHVLKGYVFQKEEVVIEPLSVAVPIPITLNLDDIRVIEEAEGSED